MVDYHLPKYISTYVLFPYTDKQHDVIFTIYAPTVFATLRAALGISHEDFLMVRLPQKIYSIAATIVMFGSQKCKKYKSIAVFKNKLLTKVDAPKNRLAQKTIA